MADLHATLDELSGLIQGEHPELAGRLRPGRSDEEIATLAEDLHLLAHVGPRLAGRVAGGTEPRPARAGG
jgi:hypothetical protein